MTENKQMSQKRSGKMVQSLQNIRFDKLGENR